MTENWYLLCPSSHRKYQFLCPSSQGYGFSSGHVWMWEFYCEEGWAPKNWCFWTVVLEKILESPLDCKRRSNQSILKEISPGISLEGMMLKLKLQYFGHLVGRADSLEKTWCWEGLGAGGERDDWGWDGGWHHGLDGRESEWTLGDGDEQGGLACCESWDRKESDTTERLNWTELNWQSSWTVVWMWELDHILVVWLWELDHKESWALKNCCFWTVVLEKILESPLDCKEIKSVLKEISPEYPLEGLMLKLKLQYFGHLMQGTDSLEKTLMLGLKDWKVERLKAGGERDNRG